MNDDLIALDEVLEQEGWDHPGRFVVMPTGETIVEFEGHPCDILQSMWAAGRRVPEGSTGIALVAEGRRHVTADELALEQPEKYADLIAVAAEESGSDDYDQLQTLVQRAWAETVADVPASTFPEEITKQVRNTVVVLQTGVILAVVRDFGGESKVLNSVPAERLHLSRVPHFMWQFLVGQEPTD